MTSQLRVMLEIGKKGKKVVAIGPVWNGVQKQKLLRLNDCNPIVRAMLKWQS